jgi:hypothetical protein
MRRLPITLAALALTACATSPAPTLELAGNRLFVAATINALPVSALLDSAAEMSFADSAWARANGLAVAGADVAKGSGGTAEVSFAKHVSIAALGAGVDDATVAVLDLSDISKRLVGRPVPFILGREIFDKERLAIDIEGGSITVADRTRTPAGVALPLTGARGIESFEAHVNGQPVGADFDLGNGTDIMMGKAMAEKLGLLSDPAALETRKGGGIGGEIARKIVRLKTLEIAGLKFENVEAAIDENDSAGDLNVGVSVLRKFRITTDFEQRRIWLAPR